ncbi:MAG: HAD family phosphatase [Oceanicoccus sp.]
MTRRDIVIFDLGNVLIDFDPRQVYREYYKGDELALEHFFESRAMWDILDHGHNTLNSWDTAFDNLKSARPDLKNEIDLFCRDWFKFILGPMQPTLDIFHQLHENNIALYALTNWPSQVWPPQTHPESNVQYDYSFLEKFNDIVVSGIEQIKKPDPALYQLALERWQIDPQRCIFVDDLYENIETANNLGILGHHFTSAEKLAEELKVHGLLA